MVYSTKYVLILILLLSFSVGKAQTSTSLDTIWLNYYGGKRADGLQKIIETYDNKIVGVGHSKSSADFERKGKKKKNTKEELSSGGNDDMFLLQINKDGKEEYVSVLGKAGKEVAHSIVQTYDGGYIIVGYTNAKSKDALGEKDAWIVKLDSEKKHCWNKRFGSAQDDAFTEVTQVNNGDIVVCGYQGNQGFVVSLDWLGNVLQERLLTKKGTIQVPTDIIQLQDGNFAIGGISTNKSKSESFFQKLSPNLTLIGSVQYYFERWADDVRLEQVRLLQLPNQNIILSSPTDPQRDAILVGLLQLDTNGQLLKVNSQTEMPYFFEAENDSYPFDMTLGVDEKIYITGASKAHNKGGSANKNKFFLLHINTDFTEPSKEWTFYGGNFEDRAYSLLSSQQGHLFIAGASNSQNAYWGGGENACIVKTSPVSALKNQEPATLKVSQTALKESSKDDFLEANEIGYIEVTIQNNSDVHIPNFQASISASTSLITFPKKMNFGRFDANTTKVIGIPIKGKPQLGSDVHDFTIQLSSQQPINVNPILCTIKSRKPSKSNLQVVASNFESIKNLVPEQETTLKVTLKNTGDKAATLVSGYFNFEGRNVIVLSDQKRISVGTIEAQVSKEFEITFKVPTIDRGIIIKAKFTFSSDTNTAYDIQEIYPFQVDTDIPLPTLTVVSEEWNVPNTQLPRDMDITVQFKVINEGAVPATDLKANFQPSSGIITLSDTTFTKNVMSVGGNWIIPFKFRIPTDLDKNDGMIEFTLSSKETNDKTKTIPLFFEKINPPNLVLIDQNMVTKNNILIAGNNATLELKVKNIGDRAATNTTFTFAVNKGLTAESNIKQNLDSIEAGETKTITFDFKVLSSFTESNSSIDLSVQSDQNGWTHEIPMSFPINISPIPQKKPPLLVAQYIVESDESTVMKGTSTIYKVIVSNKGELPATGVRVQLGLERGVDLRSDKVVTLDEIAGGTSKTANFQFSIPEEFKGTQTVLTTTLYSKEKPYIGGKRQQYPVTVIPSTNRPDPDYDVVMMWRFPGETESKTDTIHQQLQLFASSKLPLSKEDFRIYVNDVWVNESGSKFGKVSLDQTDRLSGRYEFKLDAVVRLDKTLKKNKIVVKVIKGKQTYLSKPRILIYERDPVNLHFVGIGISKYTELNGPDDLQFAAKDVLDIADIFKDQEGVLFSNVYAHVLTNEKQTRRADVISKLEDLGDESYQNKINKNDVLIFYISSHGLSKGSEFKIMPSDYQNKKNDNAYLLDFERDILYHLNRTGIKNIFVFVDACHSGSIASLDIDNLAHSKSDKNPFISVVLHNILNEQLGIVPIVSCQAGELSWEHPDWQNGAFTEAFKEAFNNASVTVKGGRKTTANGNVNDQKLSFLELFYFLQLRVPYIVEQKKSVSQTPYMPDSTLEDLREREKDFPGSLDLFILR